MSLLLHRIRAWRLPKPLLYALGAICLALSLVSARIAWQNAEPDDEEILTLSGKLIGFHEGNFKTSEIMQFRFKEFCAEFVTIRYETFDYAAFREDYAKQTNDLTLRFAVRKIDSASIASCRTVELLSLASENAVYFALAERNKSALSAKRLVAGGMTALLIFAGLLAVFLGSVSLKDSDNTTEIWQRENIS